MRQRAPTPSRSFAESGEFRPGRATPCIYYRIVVTGPRQAGDGVRGAWLARSARQIGQVRAALDWPFSPHWRRRSRVALTVAAVPCGALSLMEEMPRADRTGLSRSCKSRDSRRNINCTRRLARPLFLTKGSCPAEC